MYHKHFGFVSNPFQRDIPSNLLFETACFKEAAARILYTCKRRSLAVITGEVGAGKSTLLRMIKERLDENSYTFIYIADSNLTPRTFYTLALSYMGIDSPNQLPKIKTLFKKVVLDFYELKGKTCVFAIDEAQSLETSMIQELKFIMNFKTDSFSPIAVILAGQSELRPTLRTLYMAPIWRRIDTSYHLSGMTKEEAKQYISHQISRAGCNRPLFPDDVISKVHERSKGIPSVINTICKGCLIDAASRNQELIDVENLNRVLTELI